MRIEDVSTNELMQLRKSVFENLHHVGRSVEETIRDAKLVERFIFRPVQSNNDDPNV